MLIIRWAISKVMDILVLYRPTQILGQPVQETWFFEGHVQGDHINSGAAVVRCFKVVKGS
jgi:hypothetical protein